LIEVEIEDAAWTAAEPDAEALARAAAAGALEELDAAPSPSPLAGEGGPRSGSDERSITLSV